MHALRTPTLRPACRPALWLAPAAIALLAASAPATAQDADADLLRRLSAGPALPGAAAGTADGSVPNPRVVYTASGDDNVATIALHPDADGDGVPDIIVGWDIFKTGDNLHVLPGAGFDEAAPVWSLETQDGLSGGYFWDMEQATAFPDITLDGRAELLTGSAGGGRAATLYDGATGTVLQSFDTYLGAANGWVYAVAALPDVNANGTPDFALAVGSTDDAVYVVDGAETGHHHRALWRFQGADAFFTLAVVPDIDGDGLADLVAGSGDNSDDVWALRSTDGGVLWKHDAGGSVHHVHAFPDVDGDGRDELAVGVWSSGAGVQLLDGASGTALWSSGAIGTYVMRVIPMSDVNADGRPDLAVASWADFAYVISGLDGSALWATPAGGDVWAIDRIDDVTGDGLDEVAYGSFNGFAYLADGQTGSVLWEHPANGHKVLRLLGAPDLDADGRPEVIAGAQQLASGVDTLLFVLDADSGLATSGPELRRGGSTALGATVTVELSAAQPGHLVYLLLGPDPALAPLGNKGWLGLVAGTTTILAGFPVPPGGGILLSGGVPIDPLLDGLVIYTQMIVLAPSPPTAGQSTNRVGMRFGN